MGTHRIAAGLYRSTDGRYRIERVNAEAREQGFADGWHLFDDADTPDPYVGTFVTKGDALEVATEHAATYPLS